MPEIVQLSPHTRMTVTEAIQYVAQEHAGEPYQDVMILAEDQDGTLIVRSSNMTRKAALWLLHEAIDHARGK